jgi:hypothetical protein
MEIYPPITGFFHLEFDMALDIPHLIGFIKNTMPHIC